MSEEKVYNGWYLDDRWEYVRTNRIFRYYLNSSTSSNWTYSYFHNTLLFVIFIKSFSRPFINVLLKDHFEDTYNPILEELVMFELEYKVPINILEDLFSKIKLNNAPLLTF